MKKQSWTISLLATVMTGLLACSPVWAAQNKAAWTPQALLGSHWVDAGPAVGDTPISLDIGKDSRLSGNAGCNRYMGKAEVSGKRLRLMQGGATRMMCIPQALMDAETQFLAALDKTRSARQEQGLLLLLDESGKVLWRFKPRG